MGTLAEIEAAVPSLNIEQLEQLEIRLRDLRQQRLAARRQTPTNLTEFAGSLRLTEDPLAFQHRVREEWE